MVFVLNQNKQPLNPCHPAKARKLLKQGKAVIHKRFPFTIRLKERKDTSQNQQRYRIKLDPGSKTTGIAILKGKEVVFLAELHHKTDIKQKLESRRNFRRSRRNRKTRYRQARFDNRKRKEGWIPPSLQSRVDNMLFWVKKLQKLIPLINVSMELVKFDTQKMQNPEISGMEYQQGELQGYEVREYLLEKFGRKCAYCEETNVPLEVEHFIAKSKGGTNRVSNLTISCRECNEDKGNLYPHEWMEKCRRRNNKKDVIRLKNIPLVEKRLKEPLKDAAFMNATRYRLVENLKECGLPLELSTGAKTKMNRIQANLPKEHYFDACCVGDVLLLSISTAYVNIWKYEGRGNRQMARVDKYGFPLHHNDKEKYDKDGNRKGHRRRQKQCHGFQSGDMVKAVVPKGKYKGTWIGFASMRSTGSADIKTIEGKRIAQGVHSKYFTLLQRFDGYVYRQKRININTF